MPKGIPKDRARKRDLIVTNRGKRNNIDRETDKWFIAKEWAKGKSATEITKELNERNDYTLSRQMVSSDINDMLVEFKKSHMADIGEYINKELFRISALERVAMENFEASKTIRPQEYASMLKLGYTVEEVDAMYENRPLPGNATFIQTMINLQEQRMKLLGIENGNDVSQTNIVNYHFEGMDIDDLAKIADGLQDNKAKEIIASKADEQ